MNQALKYGVALLTTTALPALAMAEGTSLLGQATTEMGGMKGEVLALGAIIIGISIAFAAIRVGRRGTNAI